MKTRKLLFIATLLLFFSCEKIDNIVTDPREVEEYKDVAEQSNAVNIEKINTITIIETAIAEEMVMKRENGNAGCYSLNIDSNYNILGGLYKKVTIDYGSGCVDADGRTRKGLIYFLWPKQSRFRDLNNDSIFIVFDNLEVTGNDYTLKLYTQGKLKCIYDDSNNPSISDEYVKYRFSFDNYEAVFNNNDTSLVNINYMYKKYTDPSYSQFGDIELSDESSITTNNKTFSVVIDNLKPIVFSNNCNYPKKGLISLIDRSNNKKVDLKFSEDCSNKVRCTWNWGGKNKTIDITL
jgi:hypothetical protein